MFNKCLSFFKTEVHSEGIDFVKEIQNINSFLYNNEFTSIKDDNGFILLCTTDQISSINFLIVKFSIIKALFILFKLMYSLFHTG